MTDREPHEELRRRRTELEASRDRYVDLFDLAPIGYVIISEQGLILAANLAAAALLGAAQSALVSQPLSRFVFPQDQNDFSAQRKQLGETKTWLSWDMRIVRADGASFWANVQAALVQNGECRITLSDASERKRAEEELLISERRLREAQRIGNLGSLDWNLATNQIALSDETMEMYGFDTATTKPTLEEIVQLLHPEDRERVENSLRTVIAGGARHDLEHRMVRPDGREIFIRATAELIRDPDGKPVRLLGTIFDITESKAIENAQAFLLECGYLRPNEDFFKSLARYLAETLRMDYVCIDRLEGSERATRTMAIFIDGAFDEKFEFCLKDTLCDEKAGTSICLFDKGVRQLFPQDVVLQKLMAESYVGMTLWGFGQKPIGLITMIGRKPLVNLKLVKSVLKAVAQRAGAELERKRGEEQIQSLARFPSENPNPVLRFSRTGVILYANGAAEALLEGWGCSVGAIAPEFLQNATAEAYEHKAPRTITVPLGQQVWSVFIVPVADAGYVNLYATNVTESELSEAALRESEERYRVIAESSHVLIFFLDPGGHLRWHNPTSRELLGAVPEGDDLFRRVHPDDSPQFAAAWRLAREGQESPAKIFYRLQAVDGGYRTLESVFRRITFAGEELWCVISTDATELTKLRRKVTAQQGIPGFVGRDPKMLELYATIRDLAEVSAPVLIQGESGTGKELVAGAIHREGPRAGKPFVPVNCGALPENLLESELFGHVRGAFTGAIRDKKGRFELADGGTIFLDEIGDLTQVMQVKLLRVLQEGTFERVGGEKTLRVDVRVISATHKNLRGEVAAGRFREDLYYRLCVVPINLPPLRERGGDILLLAAEFLKGYGESSEGGSRTLGLDALRLIEGYPWPGNVRELQNALQYAVIKATGPVIGAQQLPPTLAAALDASHIHGRPSRLSRSAVDNALRETGGNRAQAARRLGVSRATLYRFFSTPGA